MAGRRMNQLLAALFDRSPRAVASGTYTGTGDTTYDIEITTAGVSAAAVATWRQITNGVIVASGTSTLTSGTAASIGALGLSLTVYWTGRIPAGQSWRVEAFDTGNLFGPALPHSDLLVDPGVPLAASPEGGLLVCGCTRPTTTVTIAAGGTTASAYLDIRGFLPIFTTDVAFTGTDITFLHSFDGITAGGVLKDGDGNAVTLTGAATTVQTLIPVGNDATALAAAYYIKIVKSTAQGAGAPTVITVGQAS